MSGHGEQQADGELTWPALHQEGQNSQVFDLMMETRGAKNAEPTMLLALIFNLASRLNQHDQRLSLLETHLEQQSQLQQEVASKPLSAPTTGIAQRHCPSCGASLEVTLTLPPQTDKT